MTVGQFNHLWSHVDQTISREREMKLCVIINGVHHHAKIDRLTIRTNGDVAEHAEREGDAILEIA
jgi:hypothetical protein